MDNEAILDFVDAGRDVILAVDSQVSEEIRNLAADLGVDLEASGSAVLDHSNHVLLSKAADPTVVASDKVTDLTSVLGSSKPTVKYLPACPRLCFPLLPCFWPMTSERLVLRCTSTCSFW